MNRGRPMSDGIRKIVIGIAALAALEEYPTAPSAP